MVEVIRVEEEAMVTNTRERRLWWRHLMSVLLFPVTVTLVVPALIVIPAGLRGPQLGVAATVGLVTVGCLLIAAGLALMIWTNVLFDRVGEGTLGLGNVM